MALQGDTIHDLPLFRLGEVADAELEIDATTSGNGPRQSGRIKVSDLGGARATNELTGSPKSVIYLTQAEAIAAGREGVATLDLIAPLTVATGTMAYIDLPSDGNHWRVARYDGNPEPAFKGFYDGDGERYYNLSSDGLVGLQWVVADASTPVPPVPGSVSAAEIFSFLEEGPGITLTLTGNKIVISTKAAAPPRPPAPTKVLVDDIGNTLSALLVPGYTTVAEYGSFGSAGFEAPGSAITAGAYIQNGRLYLPGITGPHDIGTVGLYVLGSGARPDGFPATNDRAFTGATATGGTITPGPTAGDPGIIVFTTTSY